MSVLLVATADEEFLAPLAAFLAAHPGVSVTFMRSRPVWQALILELTER